ncbi:MAG: flavoprotein [Planctomycetota bacterium]|jgi:phosphopantothenoylcysteine decarboxylase/phosphopantothenate--cysteine ligase|nr:flavoprotein [Planctomycetota bacterium]MDP6761319.1 flavoprotein [Planctomycetota bacterium]MDP6991030.1 flavoprotein [Planctomycetota bacterium]
MSRILLGVSASVAAYKACDLASRLTQQGHSVRALLTPRATELVGLQLFEAVTGQPAACEEFGPARVGAMDHIELGRWGEALVLAPATADLIGRVAQGLAGDLLTTVAMALPADRSRMVCPAMNPHMLASPPVQRNIATLVEDGWSLVEPEEGLMACGDEGPGRLAEPGVIAERLAALLER